MDKRLRPLGKRPLSFPELVEVVRAYSPRNAAALAKRAARVRRKHYGNDVYIRGLIEIDNICKNNCYYCGIRRGNTACERYALTDREILACCEEGYAIGLRTFVLQGGENPARDDPSLCALIREIKTRFPDCAVTLSLGERSKASYAALREAGADRYLLRHETADLTHYGRLHPAEMSFSHRFECLRTLRKLGFQVGAGMMVGSPYQTAETLATDLLFLQEFQPEMCGIGPFIPHHATPFAAYPAGDAGLTCYLLSVVRLLCPAVLLPATTALQTLSEDGRTRGIRAGANVVMPNLSPAAVRNLYALYDNKAASGTEAAEHLTELTDRIHAIGYRVCLGRGDHPMHQKGVS